ncbi:hypothetical protein DDJ48_01690 [Mycobacteroides abscessus]|uniref:hypothetical protein n=1 Tax=Mycobacteroides abscessus TaxID=36809 RepID=UPI000D3E43E5|nr:hypothetical protein [Mycobacteroides abscessus]PVA44670.1 hypothetical protein DDJ48_01690 [Mycobacteroides abscessus]RIT93279.1 hypothetical protein D2F00_20945 [Mycobacteroides abscessus]
MLTLLFMITIGVVIWLALRPTPERDAQAAQSWANFHHYTASNGWTLLHVQSVYKHGNRGSKARVSVYGDTTRTNRDSWFWWHQAQRGSVVAVRGLSQGWGPHTHRDDVLYIGNEFSHQDGIQAVFDARELKRAQQHWSRHQGYLGGSSIAA